MAWFRKNKKRKKIKTVTLTISLACRCHIHKIWWKGVEETTDVKINFDASEYFKF